MSRRTESFSVEARPRVEVRISRGDLTVLPGPAGTIEVDVSSSRDLERLVVEQRGDTIVVEGRRERLFATAYDVRLVVPEGTDLEAKLGVADLVAEGTLGSVRVGTGAGDIRLGDATGPVNVKTAAGDLMIGEVRDRLEIATASGDVKVEGVDGDAEVNTASGDVVMGRASGRVEVRVASGDIDVRRLEGSRFEGKSLSGDIKLGIPPGRSVDLDVQTLSGDLRSDFDVKDDAGPGRGDEMSIRVKTISGNVHLTRA